MAETVLVRSGDGRWREPRVTAYVNERELQNLVEASPHLLTSAAMATVDEFPITGIGQVDIVGVAADGAITIVECKLRANSEIRRAVVGQILAYAGGLWKMTYDEFAETWSARRQAGDKRPVSLVEAVAEACEEEVAETDLRNAVQANLDSGAFTLVIAVDEITEELKRIVEYLNIATRDEVTVLAAELQFLNDSGLDVLIPRTYGESLSEVKRNRSTGRRWDEDSFAREVAQLPDDERAVIERLLQHGRQHGSRPFYGSGQRPGMSYYYRLQGHDVSLFAVYAWPDARYIAPSIGAVNGARHLGEKYAERYLELLRSIPHLEPRLRDIDGLNRYPNIPVADVFTQPGVVERFCQVLDQMRSVGTGADG